jgi:hypothetical protein
VKQPQCPHRHTGGGCLVIGLQLEQKHEVHFSKTLRHRRPAGPCCNHEGPTWRFLEPDYEPSISCEPNLTLTIKSTPMNFKRRELLNGDTGSSISSTALCHGMNRDSHEV